MNISLSFINTLFENEDIEGLINLGAPTDEYFSEATYIFSVLSEMTHSELTLENITKLIATEWMKNFDIPQEGMAKRMPSIQKIAEKILRKIREIES